MDFSVYIVVDVSGSMKEMGKVHLLRNLCRYANQLVKIDQENYAGLEIGIFGWGQNILKINPQNSGDLPVFLPGDSISFDALSNFLSKPVSEFEDLKVLILSDGNFERDGLANFIKWTSGQKRLLIRTVAIGADANLFNLKKISTNDTVFEAENITSAFNSTIWGTDEPLTAPKSIAQILRAETEDNWDA